MSASPPLPEISAPASPSVAAASVPPGAERLAGFLTVLAGAIGQSVSRVGALGSGLCPFGPSPGADSLPEPCAGAAQPPSRSIRQVAESPSVLERLRPPLAGGESVEQSSVSAAFGIPSEASLSTGSGGAPNLPIAESRPSRAQGAASGPTTTSGTAAPIAAAVPPGADPVPKLVSDPTQSLPQLIPQGIEDPSALGGALPVRAGADTAEHRPVLIALDMPSDAPRASRPSSVKVESRPSRAHGATSGPIAASGTATPVPVVLALPLQPAPCEGSQANNDSDGEPLGTTGVKAGPRRTVRAGADVLAAAGDTEQSIASHPAETSTAGLAKANISSAEVQASAAVPPQDGGAPPGLQSAQPAPSVPITPPATLPVPPPHAPARSPADQVAPVMVSLASNGTGTHRLVLRLDPPELGHLEVRMTRSREAGARIEVMVEKPATLALLRQEEPALHRALSDAGVPSDGRSVTIQLGQPGEQPWAGQTGGGLGGSPRRARNAGTASVAGLSMADVPPSFIPRALRSALDITA